MRNIIQKYLFLKLEVVRKLHHNYEQEQSAIFENDTKQMHRILEEREKYFDQIAALNEKISHEMDLLGVMSLKPKKHPLLYRIDKKIENSMKTANKKNASNKLLLQFIAMHTQKVF